MSVRLAYLVLRMPVLCLAFFFAGCAIVPADVNDEVYAGPFYLPRNYFSVKALPSGVGRVVLLPTAGGNLASEEALAVLDGALRSALVRVQRFEVTTLGRVECRALFGRPELRSTDTLPNGFLEDIKARTGAQAVLLVDLTSLKLYQPQSLGLRAKLVSCSDGGVYWSFDEVVSASDVSVRNSARREYFQQEHGNRPYDFSLAGLQSPSWFAAFVARQMFGTLPPR